MKHLLSIAIVMILFVANSAHGAYEFYVTIDGAKQGKFKGESVRDRQKEKIAALAFHYEVTSPRDAASGQASGKRQHKPLTITKPIGGATPQLFQALTTNENLKTVTLEFTKTNPNGEEYVYYTIKLTNASISNIRQFTQSTQNQTSELEEISFTFQGIELQNADAKTMAVDSVGGGAK